MIVSPVSRQLRVIDRQRSLAFYRDVLGFAAATSDDGSVHLTSGPAQLDLVLRGTDESGARDVVFIVRANIAAMHADLADRGAAPGPLARVNWIKMQMFDLRDPDGHVLWFGQSFAEPPIEAHTPPGTGQCRAIMPSFPVDDVATSVAHYRNALGFTVNYQQSDLAVLDRDSIRLLLTTRAGQGRSAASCCVYVRDADQLYQELRSNGARVGSPPASRPWGLRDFAVLDLAGNEIVFAQTFE